MVALDDGDVLVFGGSEFTCPPGADCETPQEPPFSDAAIWSRETDAWRAADDLPVPTVLADTAVVGGVLFAYTRTYGSQERHLIAYEPDDDMWREIETPSAPTSGYRSLGASDELLLLYLESNELGDVDDWTFDPATEQWEQLPANPLGAGFNRTLIGLDSDIYLFDAELVDRPNGADGPSLTRAARFDGAVWSELPTSDSLGSASVLRAGNRLISPALGCADGGETNGFGRCIPFGAVFDTATEEWGELPNAPGRGRKNVFSAGGFSSEDLVVSSIGGAFLDASDDTWFDMPELDDNDADSVDSTSRWPASLGDAVMVVGGDSYTSLSDPGELLGDAWIWTP